MENINYQLEMEKEINKIKNNKIIPTLLLHSCCAPCSSCVIERLSSFFKITILYYNPNIYPEIEYEKRKEEEKKFIRLFPSVNKVDFIDCNYDKDDFYNAIKGYEKCKEGEYRCYICYNLRMEKTCQIAKKMKFDYFTTTLSISPCKNSKWVNEIGYNLEKKYNIKYLPADFKKKDGYKRSIILSKEYNLYRQDYCGCKYSKKNKYQENV